MTIIFYTLIVAVTFLFMEFVAWASHKYLMHGALWGLHSDHHGGGYTPFQKNDSFFLIFAIPCWLCIMLGMIYHVNWVVAIGGGIFLYGCCYFLVHDVVIHQRFKWFTRSNNKYIKVIRWAHKMHHKHLDKENGESFGLLIVPAKYWRKIEKDEEAINGSRNTPQHQDA
ncbi:MAG: sterol desaturase family protein [Flavipsychrobacter sp.]|nr:sterol desaturase family protein [Flavipsychrobacter sp.]